MGHWWNNNDWVKLKYTEIKLAPVPLCPPQNPTQIRPGLNLGLRSERRDEMAFSEPNSTANKARFIVPPSTDE